MICIIHSLPHKYMLAPVTLSGPQVLSHGALRASLCTASTEASSAMEDN